VGFFAGFACAFRGVAWLAATPSLWAWAIAPVVASIALLGGGLLLYDRFGVERLREWIQESAGGGGASEWLTTAATVVAWLVVAVVVVFAFSMLVRLIAAPFLALLADGTVAKLSGRPTPAPPGGPLVRWVLRPIVEALKLLAIKLAVTLVALPLLLIPVAGHALFWIVAAALFGLDLLDVALSARGLLLRERLRFARARSGACFGLGVASSLLLLVPCVNVFLLPGCVVGAVLLDQRLSPDFPRAAA
jgi:uncharacterized protein involved in cysteine biosynthesis